MKTDAYTKCSGVGHIADNNSLVDRFGQVVPEADARIRDKEFCHVE